MNSGKISITTSAFTVALIGGTVFLFSFFVYGARIFDPTMSASAYSVNAITLGIAYTMCTTRDFRSGSTALFVWYIVVTGLFFHPHTGLWNFMMEASYVLGLTGAVALYCTLVEKRLHLHHWIQRCILWTALVGLAHASIVILLQLITLRLFSHVSQVLYYSYQNLRSGTMVGLISSIGVEVAEYIIAHRSIGEQGSTENSEVVVHNHNLL